MADESTGITGSHIFEGVTSFEPKTRTVPFRGGHLEILESMDPGSVAVIAQIAIADPRFDAFYRATGTIVCGLDGSQIWPETDDETFETPKPAEELGNGLIDLLNE